MTDLFWMCAVVAVFVGALILGAAVLESRWTRGWIKRMQGISNGKRHQEAEYIAANTAWRDHS